MIAEARFCPSSSHRHNAEQLRREAVAAFEASERRKARRKRLVAMLLAGLATLLI